MHFIYNNLYDEMIEKKLCVGYEEKLDYVLAFFYIKFSILCLKALCFLVSYL